jgi:uncharacterized delta-60 repeat protein
MKNFLTIVIVFILCKIGIAQSVSNVDLSFYNAYAGINGEVHDIVKQSDGKIIIGGSFSLVGSSDFNNLVRLKSDGSIDSSFTIGLGFDNVVYAIALQSNGKIIVGGSFLNYDGNLVNRIVRLNSDGTLDNSFNSGQGFNNDVLDIAVQSDDKIIVVGSFTYFNGIGVTSAQRFIRLNSNGTYDNTLNSLSYTANNTIRCVNINPAGNIQLGGDFTTFATANSPFYAVIVTSIGAVGGNVNNVMNIPSGSSVRAIQNMTNGDFIVAGTFGLRRNTSSGPVTMPSFDGAVLTLAEDNFQNLYVGGNFTNGLARINSSNQIDLNFPVGNGFDGYLNTAVILEDSIYFAGGNFANYKTTSVLNSAPIRIISNCQNSFGSISADACFSYTAPDGITYYTSGTYNYTTSNVSGCDSIVTINLTIRQPIETYISTEACDSFVTGSGNVYTIPGSYQETLTAANGCDSTVFYQIFFIHQTSETITVAGDSLSSDMANATSYQWYDCVSNTAVPGANQRVFYPSVSGDYKVIASVSLCTVESECITFSATGTGVGYVTDKKIEIFPNPVINTLNVYAEILVSVEVYDNRGIRLIKIGENTNHVIDLSSLSAGLYFLKAGNQTIKFVKK